MKKVSLRYLLLSSMLVVVAACGPGELATPSQSQAALIITDTFEGADVTVREVDRAEDTLRVAAEFNGADVTFVMQAGEEVWEIAHVEQGGNSYTVEQLGRISETMAMMRDLSDALEAFQQDTGEFPMLDDQIGLLELAPTYYNHAPGTPVIDVWMSPFRYRRQGEDYTITSEGPDRKIGTNDDIILITGTFVTAE